MSCSSRKYCSPFSLNDDCWCSHVQKPEKWLLESNFKLTHLVSIHCPSPINTRGERKYKKGRASLVVQWLSVCLPMQGTQVQALAGEDPTCRGVAGLVLHNYWACALEPASHNCWAHVPQLLKPTRLESVLRNKRSHDSGRPVHCNEEWLPLTATRESLLTATKTQHNHK